MLKAILSSFLSSLAFLCSPNAPHKTAEAIGITSEFKRKHQNSDTVRQTPQTKDVKERCAITDSSQAYDHLELLSIILEEDDSPRQTPAGAQSYFTLL